MTRDNRGKFDLLTRYISASPPQELVAAEEEFSAITDKIPQRPVTIVEGTSYTVVIIAALGVSGQCEFWERAVEGRHTWGPQSFEALLIVGVVGCACREQERSRMCC